MKLNAAFLVFFLLIFTETSIAQEINFYLPNNLASELKVKKQICKIKVLYKNME
jgi:hypothetical protein